MGSERAQSERQRGGELKRLPNVCIKKSTRRRVEAAKECAQSERRRGWELQLAVATCASSSIHDVSSNLVFTMLWLVSFNLLCVIFETDVMIQQQNGVMRSQQGSVVESGPVKTGVVFGVGFLRYAIPTMRKKEPMSMESTTFLYLSFAVCDMRALSQICNQFGLCQVLIFCI